MSRASLIVFVAFAMVVLIGTVFLATWDIPPPTARVEKVLSDDRFSK